MIRTFGIQTLNGNAQPLFGDKITAAFTGRKNNQGWYSVPVANSAKYQVGDRIILGVASGSATNCLMVDNIPDSTHLNCQSEGDAPVAAWAINTQLMLDIACSQLLIQSIIGNSGDIYLGSDSTVTNAGGGSAFYQITVGGSYPIGQGQWNTLRTSEFWMAGTNLDKAGIAAVII